MSIRYQFSKDVSIPYVLRDLKHLTFPPFERKVASSNISGPLLCIQALNEAGEIIGVSLAEANSAKPFSEIISLYVRPDYQNQGIGLKLLDMITKAALTRNQDEARLFFRSNWNTRQKLEHLLNKLGWADPKAIMKIYKSHIREFAKVKWPLLTQLPSDYAISLWADMTEEDHSFIIDKMKEDATDPFLSPLINTKNIEKSNSLILRFKGLPAGWLIVYRNGMDSLEYNNLNILKAHRKYPRIPMLLLHRAVSIQLEKNIPECIWVVSKNHPQMLTFMERFFKDAILEKMDVMMSYYKKK